MGIHQKYDFDSQFLYGNFFESYEFKFKYLIILH